MNAALFDYLLSLADTQLILGHRLSEWAGRGPMLEEDIALSNLGLDLLGQARSLYTYAGEVEGLGRDEDKLAYFRDATEYRNLLLAEQPNGDFAQTMVRHFFFAEFFFRYWQGMSACSDETLKAIAAKAEKELAYHRRHSAEWVIRLGDGTEESRRRAQDAVDILWSFTGEMFEPVNARLLQTGEAIDTTLLRPEWTETVGQVLSQATLAVPESNYMRSGGQSGQHTEHLGYLLAEMQHLQRSYPDMQW